MSGVNKISPKTRFVTFFWYKLLKLISTQSLFDKYGVLKPMLKV